MGLSEEEIIRVYGKRWDIEVFFKICKSCLKLVKECRSICRILNDSGTPCSLKRVQRHMAGQGLRSIVVKKYDHYADHGAVPDGKVDILNRDFEAGSINKKVSSTHQPPSPHSWGN